MARYNHTIDAKGRVVVPAKLRNSIGGLLHVTNSLDKGYLSGYTDEQFRAVKEQISTFNMTNPKARFLRREIIGEAQECELDSQGRISVANNLWEKIGAKPGDEICFIDMFDKIEICTMAQYEREAEQFGDLSEMDFSEFDVTGL